MKVSVCSHRPVLTDCGLKDLDYQVDPYIGCQHYCYYCYALNQSETNWTEEILIHKDISKQLSRELDTIQPQTVYMGYHTDPYQPCEADCLQTRKVLELFQEKNFSASILTKSDLVLRDKEILQRMDNPFVSFSVAFNDNHTRRLFEANTISTEARIEALYRLHSSGIKTGALICPVIPFISDVFPLIDMVSPYTDVIWIYGLSITDPAEKNWLNVMDILNRHFPDIAGRIREVVCSKAHSYWNKLRQELMRLQKKMQLDINIHL